MRVLTCVCALRLRLRFLKSQNQDIQIVGLQPSEGASIAGIRRWPKARQLNSALSHVRQCLLTWQRCAQEYLPSIFDDTRVDRTLDIGQAEARACIACLGSAGN